MARRRMQSLKAICLDRIIRLVKRGLWNRCARNPFSVMPVQTVDTLFEFLLGFPTYIRTSDMRLLFQSGQLSQLELQTLIVDDEKRLLLTYLTENACKNLRILRVSNNLSGASAIPIITGILKRCHGLEEFHSKVIIDMDDLRHCNNLKTLRLHIPCPSDAITNDFFHKTDDFCKTKPDLEVFSICDMQDGSLAYKALAAALLSCPKLISLGFADSLEALLHIRKTKGAGIKLKLKRCFWGLNEKEVPLPLHIPKASPYPGKFADAVYNAVNMCPDVETLVINVYHEDALEHLIHLEKLKSLSLRFNYQGEDNITTLRFLLRPIGSSLEHLSLESKNDIPMDLIRDHCFNLRTLEIFGSLELRDDEEYCPNPLALERLHIWKADCKSLTVLLRNSSNLIELFLGEAKCLDDTLMEKIFVGDFKLPRLTVVALNECPHLTENGMRKLLSGAPNLKEIMFGSMHSYTTMNKLLTECDLDILHYFNSYRLQKKDFYVFRPDKCNF